MSDCRQCKYVRDINPASVRCAAPDTDGGPFWIITGDAVTNCPCSMFEPRPLASASPAPAPPCEVCNGTGRAPGSDNVNWLQCGTCLGSGRGHLLPGERLDLRSAEKSWRDRYLEAGKKTPTPKPPALPLLEAARAMLREFGAEHSCRVVDGDEGELHHLAAEDNGEAHGFAYRHESCPACRVRSAIAAEEARRKKTLADLDLVLTHLDEEMGCGSGQDWWTGPAGGVEDARNALLRAKMETSR